MSRFTKCEAYDLGDITRRELSMLRAGLVYLLTVANSERGPFSTNEIGDLLTEITEVFGDNKL